MTSVNAELFHREQDRKERRMELLMSNESLSRKIASDPDDEPTAGNEPTREARLEGALREMMGAYERRVRTDCTPEQLAKEPWRCAEYVAAEKLLLGRR